MICLFTGLMSNKVLNLVLSLIVSNGLNGQKWKEKGSGLINDFLTMNPTGFFGTLLMGV